MEVYRVHTCQSMGCIVERELFEIVGDQRSHYDVLHSQLKNVCSGK